MPRLTNVRCLFFTLYASVFSVGLLAVGALGLSAFVWATSIQNHFLDASKDSVANQINAGAPAYAAVMTLSVIMFVVSFVGYYGVLYRYRGPLFAFMLMSLCCSILQGIGLAVLLTEVSAETAGVTEVDIGIFTLAVMGCTLGILICSILVLSLLCVDPYGKSVYEKSLAWCAPGGATKFVTLSSWVVLAFSAGAAIYALYFYIDVYVPEANSLPFVDLKTVDWTNLGMVCGSLASLLFSILGICGGRKHNFRLLIWYLRLETTTQLFVALCSIVLLIDVGRTKKSLFDENQLVTYLDQLAKLSIMSASVMMLTGFQLSLTLFVGVVMVTDADSVYRADYL